MTRVGTHPPRDVLTRLVPGVRPALLAGLATVVVLVGSTMAQDDPPRAIDGAGLVLAAVASLSLAWAPRFPRGVLTVVVLAVCGYLAAGYPFGPVQLCLAAAVFLVGRRTSFRDSAWACGIAVVAVAVVVHPRLSAGGGLRFDELGAAAWAAGWLVAALVAGRAAARRGPEPGGCARSGRWPRRCGPSGCGWPGTCTTSRGTGSPSSRCRPASHC